MKYFIEISSIVLFVFVLKVSVAWTLPGVASAWNLDIPQLMQLASGTRQGQPPGGTLVLSDMARGSL